MDKDKLDYKAFTTDVEDLLTDTMDFKEIETLVTDANRVDYIMDLEGGELSVTDVLGLFSHLLQTGLAWKLQGFYGRTAQSFIDNGYLTREGKVLDIPDTDSEDSTDEAEINQTDASLGNEYGLKGL